MRWRIIRTLLWKEALRFRYNWGLLIMVGAVLALSALVSLGERMGELPGQANRAIKVCVIRVNYSNPTAIRWCDALLSHEPEWFTEKNRSLIVRDGDPRLQERRGFVYPDDYLMIDLSPPWTGGTSQPWHVRYSYQPPARGEVMLYRFWLSRVTQRLLGHDHLVEDLPGFTESEQAKGEEDRLPKIMTGLVIFAFYLLSFNLYITSTAEEREKKALLALMLSPARPSEVIGAKVIFYSLASLAVSTGVVALFNPSLLLQPLLWSTILAGSIAYVCIGTVVLCIVRRQSTINTVSMMYLLAAALVMSLSVFLLPFAIARHAMIENYLFHQLEMIIGGKPNPLAPLYQPIMWGLTAAWFVLAVTVFGRKGMTIAHVKR